MKNINKICPSMIIEMIKEQEKEKNEYIFDSLVFRYKLAREAEMRANIENKTRLAKMCGEDPYTIERKEKSNCERDFMRFIQILNKAIGEHN